MLVEKIKKMNRRTLILVGVAVLVLLIIGGQLVFGRGKSEEQVKTEIAVANTVLNGWRVKHDARLEINKDKIRDLKQKLMEYYDAESGSLAEQQRLINALIAADQAAATGDRTGQKVLTFDISDITFKALNVGKDKAELEAVLEYYIKYETMTQNYSTFGKNRYKWQLKKVDKDWKIIKEELVPGEDS